MKLLLYICCFLCFNFIACKGEKSQNNSLTDHATEQTSDPHMNQVNDKEVIRKIFEKLEKDYKYYILIEDEPMYEYNNAKSDYIKSLTSKMKTWDYVSPQFITLIEKYMQNHSYNEDVIAEVRQGAEPIFACSQAFSGIQIKGMDLEGDEAVVFTELYEKTLDESGCPVDFTLRKSNGNWKIVDRTLVPRSEKVQKLNIQNYTGLYESTNMPTITYVIAPKSDSFEIQKCISNNCSAVGTIQEVSKLGGKVHISLEGMSGEMVPSFYIQGSTLFVRDYDVDKDEWYNEAFELSEGAG